MSLVDSDGEAWNNTLHQDPHLYFLDAGNARCRHPSQASHPLSLDARIFHGESSTLLCWPSDIVGAFAQASTTSFDLSILSLGILCAFGQLICVSSHDSSLILRDVVR